MSTKLLTIAVFNEANGWRLPDRHVDRIALAAGDSIEIHRTSSRAELSQALDETAYLIGQPPADDEMLSRCHQLEWLQLTGAVGDFELSLFPALHSGVRVCTAASIRAPQVAEQAMCLILALLRRLDLSLQAQAEQRWASIEIASKVRTLWGTTLGVVSMGPIGKEIALRARAFGAHVLATERAGVNAADVADEVLGAHQISELMARSDVVVVSTPRAPATEGMIGRTQLGQMKPTAILIDVSRGGVVQQQALIEVLRRGKIAGAGIDVFESEPLPPNSPLWTLTNVILTPHVSSATPMYWNRATEIICENLTRLAQGKRLIDEVHEEWYRPTTKTT